MALVPPKSVHGEIKLVDQAPLRIGVSRQLNSKRWPVFFDSGTLWMSLQGTDTEGSSIEIFQGAILTISNNGELSAVWLHLSSDPNFV